jgi:TPR repeat protein
MEREEGSKGEILPKKKKRILPWQKGPEYQEPLFQRAKNGSQYAQFAVGILFVIGVTGFPRSIEKGIFWLSEAERQGNLDARHKIIDLCLKEGSLAKINKSVQKSQRLENAEKYFIKAEERGSVEAAYRLGKLELERDNREKAIFWLEKRVEEEYPSSEYLLAKLLFERCEEDPRAKKLLESAANHKNKEAIELIKYLKEKSVW